MILTKPKNVSVLPQRSKEEIWKQYINEVKTHLSTDSKTQFCARIAYLCRFSLSAKYHNKAIFSMTLQEIQSKYPDEMLQIFSEAYYEEYFPSPDDSMIRRQELLAETIKYSSLFSK